MTVPRLWRFLPMRVWRISIRTPFRRGRHDTGTCKDSTDIWEMPKIEGFVYKCGQSRLVGITVKVKMTGA
jgi:hypothetical protein